MERDREAEGGGEGWGGGLRVMLGVRRAWCGHAVGEDGETDDGSRCAR